MKIAYYILIIKEVLMLKLIKLFLFHVIKDFNVFNNIILNKGIIFINKF